MEKTLKKMGLFKGFEKQHQLRNGNGRIRIIELDGSPVEKRIKGLVIGREYSAVLLEQKSTKYCCLSRSSRPFSISSLGIQRLGNEFT